MDCIRRSCQVASQSPIRHFRCFNGSRRAFSLSSRLDRSRIPSFLEPSSPELATLLSKLQRRVLLPQHLNDEQKKLVYMLENKPKLEAEPIEITLGDVTLPLEHLDRNRDLPSQWGTVKDIGKQSRTEADFENLLRVLEGCRDANIRLKAENMEFIVRILTAHGMQHLLLKALQRAQYTRMKFSKISVPILIMRSMHLKAFKSGWEEGETKKALGYAEQITELMEDKERLGKLPENSIDPRGSPWVIASLVELAAVRAKKHTDGKDLDGKVQKYASRLMSSLFQDNFDTVSLPGILQSLRSTRDPDAKASSSYMSAMAGKVKRVIILHNALKVSVDVLGSDMPQHKEALRILGELHDAIQTAYENSMTWPFKDEDSKGLKVPMREMEGL